MQHADLINQGKAFLDALHAAIDAHDDATVRRDCNRLANVAHGALEAIQVRASAAGVVRPLDGDPK